ncbi:MULTISPECIES: hypothetical protein [unclassified Microbacterium]|uniref:hypothetical protein n=1 Tax=unclassified Microbacterium TaxID=2609290 RepID=UPI003016F35F
MTGALMGSRAEPSDAAWRRSGDIAARILENLAQRDARAAAERESSSAAPMVSAA